MRQTETWEVLVAVNGSRRQFVPAAGQGHPGELGHQVVLGRERVPVRRPERGGIALAVPRVMRDHRLVDDVVLGDAHVAIAEMTRQQRVADGEALQRWDAHLDDEVAAVDEVGGGVPEQATCSAWVSRFVIVLYTR